MKRLVLLCVLLTFGGALPARAEAPALSVDPAFCRQLTKHTPAPDVAYQPGRDVHGKPVAPADLDGGAQIALPESFAIPLTADLFKFLNLDQGSFPFNAMPRNDINLGTLTLRGDQVFYNGRPLSPAQQNELIALCPQK